jgi:flagellar hook-basal body complex protein FliE
MTIRGSLIRFGAYLKAQTGKVATVLLPSARQSHVETAIRVMTDGSVEDFLLESFKKAHNEFKKADRDATKKNQKVKDSYSEVVVAETKRSLAKQNLEKIVSVVNKRK